MFMFILKLQRYKDSIGAFCTGGLNIEKLPYNIFDSSFSGLIKEPFQKGTV